jgi:glycosyltransferase involved in cell wall biosynthesis
VVAAARTRIFQYLPALAKAGIDAHAVPFYSERVLSVLERKGVPRLAAQAFAVARVAWLAKIVARFDLVVWQRILLPRTLLGTIRTRSRRMIYDVDDALYAPLNAPARARDAERFDRMAAVCDAVIASTRAIATRARLVQPRTFRLLSPVDTDRFKPAPRQPSTSPVIGWIGAPSTSTYLQPIIPTLADLAQRHYAQVVLVGADIHGLPPWIQQRPWSLQEEVADLAQMDIGVMPLGSDEWSQAKGGYKALQYQAAGVTCVASAVGAACEIIQHGQNGLLVHEPDEWSTMLTRLLDEEPLRQALAQHARQSVVERHSLHAAAPRLVDILQQVVASPGKVNGR